MAAERSPWLAIVNPASGRSRRASSWPRVERALRNLAVPVETVFTTQPHEGEQIARDAVRSGRDRLLVVGGDGSAHDIVNGLMDAAEAESVRQVTLAVAPNGTGNDWARSLGIPRQPAAIAAVIAAGRTALQDVGHIEFPSPAAGRRSHRWFVNVAGAGYDAYVLAQLPERVPSAIAYLRGALAGLASYRSPWFRIRAGEAMIDGRLLLAFVANGQYCGNRMHIAPAARLDDGLFDVVAVTEVGMSTVLAKLAKLYFGNILADPVVRHVTAPAVRIDSEPAAAVEADGQVVGVTPALFSIVPRALRVVVP